MHAVKALQVLVTCVLNHPCLFDGTFRVILSYHVEGKIDVVELKYG